MDGFDLATLLTPIPGDSPTGADPREDYSANALYYRLRDARSEARAAERQADAADDSDPGQGAAWGPVMRLATELLTRQAKDLEAACWLTEAWLRTEDLQGLANGFDLMAAMVDTWWDSLHPMPDDEGIARRLAPIAGLNGEGADGTLIQPLRKVHLFDMADGTPVAFWQYQQSAELPTLADAARRQQRIEAGVLPFDAVEQGARGAGRALREVRGKALRASAAWDGLDAALSLLAGSDAPGMGRVRQVLAEIAAVAEAYAEPDVMREVAEETVVVATGAAVTQVPAPGRIATREDALAVLAEVADFFRRTEPHSPLAYTLREAVRRGRLTWPELLEEIVPDTDGRAAILSRLGIRPPKTEE